MELAGKTALVTGASTGIGRSIAVVLAANGAAVGLVGRSTDRLQTTREQILREGGQSEAFSADLSSPEAIRRMWGEVEAMWNGIDILVNAAGVWHGEDELLMGRLLHETPEAEVAEVFAVQTLAPVLLSRLAIPWMAEHSRGKILNVSGEIESARGWLHYYVSKKALESFTRGLAEELREYEIQVNCVSPSDTLTEAYERFFPGYSPADVLLPSDVAQLALFLVSSRADHITGSVTVIRSKTAHSTDKSNDALFASREVQTGRAPSQGGLAARAIEGE
jgi:NAD(P)-dependent dehydrogenase (short-subunit alcohol dehydrogenase family)